MKTINILNITQKTSSNSDGDILYSYLSDNAVSDQVIIELNGSLNLSSSFLNSSVGKFIDVFGLDTFKQNVKLKTNKNTFSLISKYVQAYSVIHG
ncbi:STAS-like domain-containing protein [Flavivirga jejuensis]|uniref:DUF4325 domain-containing protein n=1 Tax=Flavivirga jejuensis TaxID=870487 RepID=A0ABT8WRJ2_9FLAO|nr:DUF4325 domain-containing protein [Flavivirga jejuensis]MDO5975609.1 DUF4325 domain-containing protein [Flavivirga jejuensis]